MSDLFANTVTLRGSTPIEADHITYCYSAPAWEPPSYEFQATCTCGAEMQYRSGSSDGTALVRCTVCGQYYMVDYGFKATFHAVDPPSLYPARLPGDDNAPQSQE